MENLPRSERDVLLADAIKKYNRDLESGAIVIALSTKFRVRRTEKSQKKLRKKTLYWRKIKKIICVPYLHLVFIPNMMTTKCGSIQSEKGLH